MQIAVVDLGVGNLRSVKQAVVTVAPEADVILTSDANSLLQADKIVLPGQGAIGTWFHELKERGLGDALTQCLTEKPLLGICVGMQAMFDYCEEDGGQSGLGLFKGSVKHFSHFHTNNKHASNDRMSKGVPESGVRLSTQKERLKIPQMGWNQVFQIHEHPLWSGIDDNAYFYFVHSFCANTAPNSDLGVVYGCANYGHKFIAAVGRDNVFAVQFHPEKSHKNGLKLLKNFTDWNGHV